MNTRILVVDDNNLNVRLLTDILQDEGYEIYSCGNGLDVLELVYKVRPEVILLDIMMPGLDGFKVCNLIKKNFEIKDIPVIMVTAKTDSCDVKKALELGAFDYIKKPIDEIEVVARVQSALRFKQHQDKLKEMAMKDGLTGLYNHALLIELFEKELKKQQRSCNNISFAMLDIDYFKNVNDTYGHMTGDTILKELSEIFVNSIRSCDTAGRYGGEEFGIILPEVSFASALDICERIRKNVEKHKFHLDSEDINITVSIGLYFKSPVDTITMDEMLKKSDEALYKAKKNGRNRVEISLEK